MVRGEEASAWGTGVWAGRPLIETSNPLKMERQFLIIFFGNKTAQRHTKSDTRPFRAHYGWENDGVRSGSCSFARRAEPQRPWGEEDG